MVFPQYKKSEMTPPPPLSTQTPQPADSSRLHYKVKNTVPTSYDEVLSNERNPIDLRDPSNVKSEAEYDPTTGCYVVRTRIGDREIVTPFILSADEYNSKEIRESMMEYYRKKNSELYENKGKDKFNIFDMKFSLGPLEKVFGPGGVQLKTQGSVQVQMGVKSNKTDNPALPASARRKTYFDFDQKIQATVDASVGDKLKFNMTYNTDATFDFDSKNLKLKYEGKEDEIIKSIEAGNVSMTTGSSLIKGSTALFGMKTKLQFGKLTVTALVSQQNSESQTVNTKGGAQKTAFSINADDYDKNRHFFLSHFFREHYDEFASKLPYVSSGINITRIEVWITNTRSSYNESRNIVGFMDLGENRVLQSSHWTPDASVAVPSNNSNSLLNEIKTGYPDARYISSVTSALEPLSAVGIEGGRDFEKIESARLLSSSEYKLNASLGYISLTSALNADEILCVAYEYTYQGKNYKVGEFSSDVTDTSQSLYLKLLKGATVSPQFANWRLMMKNVYSLGAYQVQKQNFKLNIKYLNDTTGTAVQYLPVEPIRSTPLLRVMNLDRLDSNNETNPDGFYDFLEGYTVVASQGKIIFPVAEPFGSYLESKIADPDDAKKYVYKELYDSTQTVAKQFQDKNKFILEGEYQASSGSQIRLNAMNVPRGSVVVTAGGVTLTENSDYTVDYNMGIVTITNQSIIDSGTNISVSLENQSLYSMQRKTLLGLDLNYAFNKDFNIGGTLMHFSEKPLTEKVSIGDELINNTIWGMNMSYNKNFMWLTNLVNKIPTVNATAPSTLSVQGEFAQLIPHKQKTGTNSGSSFIDDFETSQNTIDIRSPYSWFLASTPYDSSADALFPEAALSNNVDYGKNRALLAWYYVDRMFTQKNSSLCPAYLKNDLRQMSSPYIREVTTKEIWPNRELNYGEASAIQTLNLSFYPTERGPYNLDDTNIDADFNLLNPERRWGGIMRKLDNTNFESSNIEYIQFWLMDPFIDDVDVPNTSEGGDLYFNLGEVSEDILKDGFKAYENGNPIDGSTNKTRETVWGRVSTETSVAYAFDNTAGARRYQDVGLNGLHTDAEFEFPTYKNYVDNLRLKLSPAKIAELEDDQFSPFNDPAGDNYHYYRGYDYDEQQAGVLERYKHYNGTEGNSLGDDDSRDRLYQSSRSVPDVEDINQDNTLNEYERYYQYHISLRPKDMVVGENYITDKQEYIATLRNGQKQATTWYQFKIPLKEYEKKVGSISDFSTIRFIRMFLTGFRETTHLRFATMELVRGDWRTYDYNLNTRGETPAEGQLAMSVVNIEENSGREPVNYVLPPGVNRIVDPGQSQITQLNEQSLSLKVTNIKPGDARAVYKNTSLDLRIYKRLQMFAHAERLITDVAGDLKDGDFSVFLRLGTDIKNNYYEYEVPVKLTPAIQGGVFYNNNSQNDRYIVWPEQNFFDIHTSVFTDVKKQRNREKADPSSGVGYTTVYSDYDPYHDGNRVSVIGNPSLGDVRVVMVGVRNNSASERSGEVWVNELKVTDFDEDGGWAAKANVNLGISDIATVNFAGHIETVGFGGVDQSLANRRLDDYKQYNVATQVDVGRFLPEKVKLKAPVYYSLTKEKTSPKYNPLDQDILLEDALDNAVDKAERDSIKNYAIDQSTVKSFSVSGFNFGVKGKTPMPWDPANFTLNFSFNKQENISPTIEYEHINDYRGSFQYVFSPYFKPFKPFSSIKSKSKNLKFFKDWEFNYLPTSINFLTNMTRYYYELQSRNEADISVEVPVSVSKNFYWDRQFQLQWNVTKQLSLSFSSNTMARIEEAMGQVNKKLFPDRYKEWRDTVWNSIKGFGTPWNYDQTFTASYKAPFNKIPVLDFLTGNVSYNSTYKWDRGTEIEGSSVGNSIANNGVWNVDGKFNFENLYNKSKYLKEVNKRFSNTQRTQTKQKKPKKFQRTFQLNDSTATEVRHNLKTKKLQVKATTLDGKPFPIKTEIVDDNNLKIITKGKQNIKVVVTESLKEDKNIWKEIGDHAARFAMSVRSASFKWRNTHTSNIPQFIPDVGDLLGQSRNYGPMSPGLDFAFGFTDESYLQKAMDRGWLLCDQNQTSPAIFSRTEEYTFELQLEPIRGLKIQLTANHTDNRTNQVQFMYDGMPTTRTGSFNMTTCAIRTALGRSSADDGYNSDTYNKFISYLPQIAQRLEQRYAGSVYPSTGFLEGSAYAGQPYTDGVGGVNQSSSDVMIPAFIAAYTGKDPNKVTLSPFPSLSKILPNWRVTYDGLIKIGNLKKIFKSLTLSHAYQCTYSVGSFNSYLNWVSIGGDLGFTLDELTQRPVPSSPYNISSVSITEKFAPLVGLAATLNNNLTLNAEYRDSRTLTLNSDAGQLVEANQRGVTVGAGYKIANFNSVLKIKGKQQGVSNDLTLNCDFSLQNTQALIRKIQEGTSQATSGTKSMTINFTANYVLSKRITLSAYFDHQINKPLISSSSYPTTNSNYGLSVNVSLAR
ncbi:MAG: cell surface protein SprA [Candidatus Limisoma sp.]